jgi:hypothetical protein
MTTRQVTTYFMSRVIDVPAHVACAAFEAVLDDVAYDGVHLLDITTQSSASRGSRDALLRAPFAPMRVSIEVEPWSDERSQLGLRPLRWGPRVWPSSRQLSAGHDLIHRLDAAIRTWADAPLRGVVSNLTVSPGLSACMDAP